MTIIIAFVSGIIFATGILISGMANPAKVLNFFNFWGNWDPSLAFVMFGALTVAFIGYRIVLGQPKPVLAKQFNIPSSKTIDSPLIIGSILFGVGWGISGFCPGALLSVIGNGRIEPLLFFLGMIIGMTGTRMLRGRLNKDNVRSAAVGNQPG